MLRLSILAHFSRITEKLPIDRGTISTVLRIDHDRRTIEQHGSTTMPQIRRKRIPDLGRICVKVSAHPSEDDMTHSSRCVNRSADDRDKRSGTVWRRGVRL
jgi:hypothetical protein